MAVTALVVLFAGFGILTASLALYRKPLTMREDDLVHIGPGEEKFIPQQLAMTHRIAVLDRWGEIFTVFTTAFGLVAGAVSLYQVFQAYY